MSSTPAVHRQPNEARKAPRPPLSLRLGLVGHRILTEEERERVKAGLGRAFGLVSSAFARAVANPAPDDVIASGDARELVLVSALAAGADQIGAEAFLAGEAPEKRRHEVALPFRRDFAERLAIMDGGGRLAPFLERAGAVLELDDHAPLQLSPAQLDQDADERRRRELRYVAVADIVVRHSHLLIAAWDGAPGRGPGGVATTVTLALREGVPVLRVNPANGAVTLLRRDRRYGDIQSTDTDPGFETDPEAHLAGVIRDTLLGPTVAPAQDPHAESHDHGHEGLPQHARAQRYFGVKHYPGEQAPAESTARAYERMLRLTGARVSVPLEGGSDTAEDERAFFEAIAQEQDDGAPVTPMTGRERAQRPALITNHIATGLEALALPKLERAGPALLDPWAHADANATWLSHAYRSAYVLTFGLGALAVLIGLLGLLFPSQHKWAFVGVEVMILGFAIRAFWRARRNDLHARYIDARHMAEQFRPAWALAQLGLAGRKVLSASAPWSAWAVQAHAGFAGLPTDTLTPDRLKEIALAVRDRVLIDQLRYHRQNRARMRRLHHALESIGFTALVLAPAIGGGYVLAKLGEYAGIALPMAFGLPIAALIFALCMTDRVRPADRWWVRALAVAVLVIAVVPALKYSATTAATILMAGLPALAAAAAGLRYQGDFERFSKRSDRTARELARIGVALAAFRASQTPTYMELRDILLELERVLLQDIEDWRFVYAERPSPEP